MSDIEELDTNKDRRMKFRLGQPLSVHEALDGIDEAVIQFQTERPEFDAVTIPNKELDKETFEDLLTDARSSYRKLGVRYGDFWVQLDTEGVVTVRFWKDRKKGCFR